MGVSFGQITDNSWATTSTTCRGRRKQNSFYCSFLQTMSNFSLVFFSWMLFPHAFGAVGCFSRWTCRLQLALLHPCSAGSSKARQLIDQPAGDSCGTLDMWDAEEAKLGGKDSWCKMTEAASGHYQLQHHHNFSPWIDKAFLTLIIHCLSC